MGLVKNKEMYFDRKIQLKYDLPTNYVFMDHVQRFFEDEEGHTLKLNHKLQAYSFKPTNFQKMRVATSTNLFNTSTSCGLLLKAKKENLPVKTTAWFIDLLVLWFSIVKCRNFKLAIGHANSEKYTEVMLFLKECIEVFRNLNLGPKHAWKPFQTGLILATTSAIELCQYLLEERGYQYVMLGRFTNDAMENSFAQLRLRQAKPSAQLAKNLLKLYSVNLYLKDPSNGVYDVDECEYLSGFLDIINRPRKL